jgi:hypothetical protein
MMIKIGFEIALNLQVPTAVIFLLRVHPSREGDLVKPEALRVEPAVPMEHYQDVFGNRCGRVNVGAGTVRFLNEGVVRDSGELDERDENAPQRDVQELPLETLTFLLPSRYWGSPNSRVTRGHLTVASTFGAILERYGIGMDHPGLYSDGAHRLITGLGNLGCALIGTSRIAHYDEDSALGHGFVLGKRAAVEGQNCSKDCFEQKRMV